MGTIKRFNPKRMRKISGGKNPTKLVESFVQKFAKGEITTQSAGDEKLWTIQDKEGEMSMVSIENLDRPSETTIYLAVWLMPVPLRGLQEILITALSIADFLVGAKLSLVNYDLLLSATHYANHLSAEDLDEIYDMLLQQRNGFRRLMNEELCEDAE